MTNEEREKLLEECRRVRLRFPFSRVNSRKELALSMADAARLAKVSPQCIRWMVRVGKFSHEREVPGISPGRRRTLVPLLEILDYFPDRELQKLQRERARRRARLGKSPPRAGA